MVQIKLSVAFALAAAAIAPVVARPVREVRETTGVVTVRQPHHHEHHDGEPHHHHHHHGGDADFETETVTARGYEDEFEVRDLRVAGQNKFLDTIKDEQQTFMHDRGSDFQRMDKRLGHHHLKDNKAREGHKSFGVEDPNHGSKVLKRKAKVIPRRGGRNAPAREHHNKAVSHGPKVHSDSVIVARDYDEFEDMFERDFEDVDAREFDDELYLD